MPARSFGCQEFSSICPSLAVKELHVVDLETSQTDDDWSVEVCVGVVSSNAIHAIGHPWLCGRGLF